MLSTLGHSLVNVSLVSEMLVIDGIVNQITVGPSMFT